MGTMSRWRQKIQINDLTRVRPGIAVDGTIVAEVRTIDESMVQVKACLWKPVAMQLSAPSSTAMGTILFKAEKSAVRPSYLKLWTLSKWPN